MGNSRSNDVYSPLLLGAWTAVIGPRADILTWPERNSAVASTDVPGWLMTKVLIADAARDVRRLLVYTLTDAGHEVIEARGGREVLDKAFNECPDIILLDLMMPIMNGFEVLKRLRANPATEAIPVIVLTSLRPLVGESIGMRPGVTHYITKPWAPGEVELTVRVVLREAGAVTDDFMVNPASMARGSTSKLTAQGLFEDPALIRTRIRGVDQKLRGGIPLRSLTLVEGVSAAGKSVLCQHLAYGALREGHAVAYLTSDYTMVGPNAQMASLGLDVAAYLEGERLLVRPLDGYAPETDPLLCYEPERLLALLVWEIKSLLLDYTVVMVDCISYLVAHSPDPAVIRLFYDCKRLGKDGRTIILVSHSVAFQEYLLGRLQALCDAHLCLRLEYVGDRVVKTLQVCKIGETELHTDNKIGFEVDHGTGIRVLPMTTVRT